MANWILQAGAVSGGLSVTLGAFAAHALKKKITPYALDIFETGVKYQFYHAPALLAVGILWQVTGRPGQLVWAGRLFVIGTVVFSGSLYLLAWCKSRGLEQFNWLGAVTPLGGLSFIAGWVMLLLAAGKLG